MRFRPCCVLATVLLASLSPSSLFAGVPVEALGDLTADELQKKSDELKEQKYRLVDLNAFIHDGTVRYCAVWLKQDGPESEAIRNLTTKELQAKTDALKEKGHRLTRLSAVATDGELRYCAIWQKTDADLLWHANLSDKELVEKTDTYRARGYLVVELSACVVKGEVRHCAVWQKRESEGYESHGNLTGKEVQERTDAYLPAGYRVMRCGEFVLDGELRFYGVWEKKKSGFWAAHTNLNAKELKEKTDGYKEKGYHIVTLNAAVVDGEVRYCAVWEK